VASTREYQGDQTGAEASRSATRSVLTGQQSLSDAGKESL
jgi:hypothetical protein